MDTLVKLLASHGMTLSRIDATVLADAEQLLDALPTAVYVCNREGLIIRYNRRAVELWGRAPQLNHPAERFCGAQRLYRPDGQPLAHEDSPMAHVLRTGLAARDQEIVVERVGGSRQVVRLDIQVVTGLNGEAAGAIGCFQKMTPYRSLAAGEGQPHRSTAEAHMEAEQRLAAIIESSDDAILSKDLNGIIMSWNRGAELLFGYTAAEVIGKPVNMLIPADRPDEEPGILERLRRGERIDHYETVRQRKDGALVEISLSVSPIRNAEGKIVGASKIARDITDRKRAQQQQRLLLREMNHRVKNLFAVAGGVVALSARSAVDARSMAEQARGRLNALARAHELTLPDLSGRSDRVDEATDLSALVQTILSPYVDQEHTGPARVASDGPEVKIRGNAVTSLALLLHEFATNAAKYGALSISSGRVTVEWQTSGEALLLTWRECNGPCIETQPTSEGFGGLLVRATVTGQLAGQIARDWLPEGLVVRLTVPLERLAH